MKKTLIVSLAATAVAALTAISAFAALDRYSSPASTDAASVPGLQSRAGKGASRIGTGVLELARNEGLDVSSIEPLATSPGAQPANVFGSAKGTSTCAYLTGGVGAVGGCMRLGTRLVAPRVGIVDGGTYVWGFVSPSVTRVDARVAGQTFAGSVANGVFIAQIPDGSKGTGPIDLVIASGSSTNDISLPGVPTPLP